MIGQILAGFGLVVVALMALGANVYYHERMLWLPSGSSARRRASIHAAGCAWLAAIAFIGGMVVVNL